MGEERAGSPGNSGRGEAAPLCGEGVLVSAWRLGEVSMVREDLWRVSCCFMCSLQYMHVRTCCVHVCHLLLEFLRAEFCFESQ